MKINKKIIIIVLVLLLAVLFFAYSWKKYSNPSVNFSFRYPPNMKICENLDNSYVAIIDNISHVRSVSYGDFGTINGKQYTKEERDTPLTCDNFTMENSRYLVLTDLNVETNETDIKVWLDKQDEAKKQEDSKGLLPMAGLVPVKGVSEWKYIRYNDSLLPSQANNTVAEVVYFVDESRQYLILSNNRIYALKFEPIDGYVAIPLRLILKTLKFK